MRRPSRLSLKGMGELSVSDHLLGAPVDWQRLEESRDWSWTWPWNLGSPWTSAGPRRGELGVTIIVTGTRPSTSCPGCRRCRCSHCMQSRMVYLFLACPGSCYQADTGENFSLASHSCCWRPWWIHWQPLQSFSFRTQEQQPVLLQVHRNLHRHLLLTSAGSCRSWSLLWTNLPKVSMSSSSSSSFSSSESP